MLRENFVPVVVLQFDRPDKCERRFVNLAGRGIRDITAVSDGFLLLAGPVGDGDQSYQLWYWDGKDCIPGRESPGGLAVKLGELPSEPGVKPEGITVLDQTNTAWRILVVSDGKDFARTFVVPKHSVMPPSN